MYAKAVRSAKRSFFQSQQLRLEKLLGNPKSWWRKVKKLGIVKRKMSGGCLGKVLDQNGVIQSGEEAVKVWSAHFRECCKGARSHRQVGLDLVFAVRYLRVSRAVMIYSWRVKLHEKR